MKILHIFTLPFTRNGITVFPISRAKALAGRGILLDFAAPGEPQEALMGQLRALGIGYHPLCASRKTQKLRYWMELRRLIRKNRYDAVHCHGNSATLAMELLAAKLAGCRVRIAHSHNTTCNYKNLDRRLRPLFYRLYTHAVACGTDAGNWLFPGRPFRVFFNGVDLCAFRFDPAVREKMRASLLLGDALVLGHVGRFNPQKNHAFLLEAFAALKKRRPDARLLLVGDGFLEEQTRALAGKLGVIEDVVFAGSVENVADYLDAMDVMALPSRYEGFPTVLVEWQCAGLPSLVSDRVTREAALTNLVRFDALEHGAEAWAAELAAMADGRDRARDSRAAAELLRDGGFELEDSANALADFYEAAVKKR